MATTKKKTTKPKPKTTRTKVSKVKTLTKAEELCMGVSPEIRTQAVTLANAVLTMQEKIEQQTDEYKSAPLAQQVTLGTGETVLRPNPLVQEFRATVRDYAASLDNLKKILENNKGKTEQSSFENLKNRFKVG